MKTRKPRTRLRPVNANIGRPRKKNVPGETSVINCKVCGKEKTRILAGRYKKDKKWTDSEGRVFNGKTCPTCHSRLVYRARFVKKELACE